jgi:hypothetical protein
MLFTLSQTSEEEEKKEKIDMYSVYRMIYIKIFKVH